MNDHNKSIVKSIIIVEKLRNYWEKNSRVRMWRRVRSKDSSGRTIGPRVYYSLCWAEKKLESLLEEKNSPKSQDLAEEVREAPVMHSPVVKEIMTTLLGEDTPPKDLKEVKSFTKEEALANKEELVEEIKVNKTVKVAVDPPPEVNTLVSKEDGKSWLGVEILPTNFTPAEDQVESVLGEKFPPKNSRIRGKPRDRGG